MRLLIWLSNTVSKSWWHWNKTRLIFPPRYPSNCLIFFQEQEAKQEKKEKSFLEDNFFASRHWVFVCLLIFLGPGLVEVWSHHPHAHIPEKWKKVLFRNDRQMRCSISQEEELWWYYTSALAASWKTPTTTQPLHNLLLAKYF